MRNLTLFSVAVAIGFLSTTADGRNVRGTARSAMAALRPSNYVMRGKCDVRIDCPRYRITINGENAGQIICARQTGASFNGKAVRLKVSLHASSGKYMPRGFPMLGTEPSLCSGCFIHAYPWVGPGHRSLGCVGITVAAWDKIVRCGGSQIAFTALNGARSAEPNAAVAETNEIPDTQAL